MKVPLYRASLVAQLVKIRGWLPTPVFWPGEFHGLYSPWACKESDTTERLSLSVLYISNGRKIVILKRYLHPLHWKPRVFITGLPGKSLPWILKFDFSVPSRFTTLDLHCHYRMYDFILIWQVRKSRCLKFRQLKHGLGRSKWVGLGSLVLFRAWGFEFICHQLWFTHMLPRTSLGLWYGVPQITL